MLKPLLSICIPNYNRAQFLAKNLNSIAKQNQPGIEIVVCDDRSPEDIKSVIEKFKIKYPKVNLKYKQNKINLGFDKNVLKTVSLANGEYCWLLSNDDKILPESINKIIKTIKKHPHLALILINYQRYDHLLKKITSKKMISLKKDHSFNSASNFFFQKTPNA
ncbi:glycosyltransferase family 2 protein, partial [bacterium]|nr:glycosyltransferase family 2 protein [bacterium]